MIHTIDSHSFSQQRVLVRVDFNVPIDENGQITDDNRIVESLPTIKKILADGGKAILMSHLGRPKGKPNAKYSLKPVAVHLQALLGCCVHFASDCLGDATSKIIEQAAFGEVILLENVRFYAEEEKNDVTFSQSLSMYGDWYVNDAFGTAHRAHASTVGVAKYFPGKRLAGYLMIKEIEYLGNAISNPKRPLIAILGGSKVSDKIDVIENLLTIADTILIGGGMANTFAKAMNYSMGDSLVEDDKIDFAKELLARANGKIICPTDAVIADAFADDAKTAIVPINAIPDHWRVLDIGPDSVQVYSRIIEAAKTVLWNGPMGVFEFSSFNKGTFAIANAMVKATENGAITIVGGGDSAAAIAQADLKERVSHVSTGGGASLEYLEGKALPGLVILDEV